jgi:dynactin-4
MFVRIEWEAEAGNDEVGAAPGSKDKDVKEKRELAYWCVLGIGRISQE